MYYGGFEVPFAAFPSFLSSLSRLTYASKIGTMQAAFSLSPMFVPAPPLPAIRPSHRSYAPPAASISTSRECGAPPPPPISVSSTPLPRAVLSAAAVMATALTPLPHPLAVGTPVHRARLAAAIARRHLPAATAAAAAAAAAAQAATAAAAGGGAPPPRREPPRPTRPPSSSPPSMAPSWVAARWASSASAACPSR